MKRWMLGLVLSVGITLFFGQIEVSGAQVKIDKAWRYFSKGRDLLETGSPRSAVLEQWKEGLRLNSQHELAPNIAAYMPILERQVQADKARAFSRE